MVGEGGDSWEPAGHPSGLPMAARAGNSPFDRFAAHHHRHGQSGHGRIPDLGKNVVPLSILPRPAISINGWGPWSSMKTTSTGP